MNINIARTWYELAEARLKSGNATSAIESFRNATTTDHDNAQYTRALAIALLAADQIDEARQVLLRLRSAAPESGEINLDLARLAAKQGKVADAVRYYHNALFGTWPPNEMAIGHRNVRVELARFHLSQGDKSQALSEILILSSDIPDTEEAHNELGNLFFQADDARHALDPFTRVLRLNARNLDALTGGGQASFELGEYKQARRYLELALAGGRDSPEVMRLLDTTKLVLSRDPLIPGIAPEERIRRLNADLDFVTGELQTCVGKKDNDQAETVLQPLSMEITQRRLNELSAWALRRDAEGFTSGLNLIRRIETATGEICGESSEVHTALLLIARRHGVTEQ